MSNDENNIDHIEDTIIQDENCEPETDNDYRFEVSSYGWDVDVEGLVKRMDRGDIFVPGFQRGFVWSNSEKSRFIESLILGLPVPTIFLAKDSDTNKLNIIDGQQRLKTLQSYLNGKFSLSGLDIPTDLKNRYYSKRRSTHPRAKILEPVDERTLSDAVIHAIVIKPNPKDDDDNLGKEYNKAIVQIFKRLNTSGKALTAQEVRASIFYGSLLTLIQTINNEDENWRAMFGNMHSRMKDQEAILRAIALYKNGENYKASMPKFLDAFIEDNRNLNPLECQQIEILFKSAVKIIREDLGDSALKTGGTFILTRFDALVVSLMSILSDKIYKDVSEAINEARKLLGNKSVKDRLEDLNKDRRGLNEKGEEIPNILDTQRGYLWSVDKFTNDTNRVLVRLRVSKEEFSKK